jgi:hypothetical protein
MESYVLTLAMAGLGFAHIEAGGIAAVVAVVAAMEASEG